VVFDTPFRDAWGTTRMMKQGWLGSTPFVTDENKVIGDLAHWRDQVNPPGLPETRIFFTSDNI